MARRGQTWPARGGLCSSSTSLSAYGRLGYATIFPYFFVYSARQRRTCARARTVPVVEPAIRLRWSGLTEPCRVRPVAILKLTGLAVEVKSCLLRSRLKQLFCLDKFRIYVLARWAQGAGVSSSEAGFWGLEGFWGLRRRRLPIAFNQGRTGQATKVAELGRALPPWTEGSAHHMAARRRTAR